MKYSGRARPPRAFMYHDASFFTRFSHTASRITGRPVSFILAVLIVVVWVITGPVFGYSDTWQLVINTGTTIITFLMVFLIQSTQNRDTYAMQIKLDELIRAMPGAHLSLLELEELSSEELEEIAKSYDDLAQKARELLRKGKDDTQMREVSFVRNAPKKVKSKKAKSKKTGK